MPSIPIYQQQVSPSGAAALPGATPNVFGAQVGSAIVRAGQEQEQVEDIKARQKAAAEAKAQQRADEDAQADAAVRFSKVNATVSDAAIQARQQAGPGAAGHADTVLKTFDETAASAGDGITNAKASNWWRTHVAELRTRIDVDENTFEAGARANKLATDVGATIDTEANTLFTDPDQGKFPLALKRTLGTVDAMGVDDATKEKLRTNARDSLSDGYIRGLAKKDPYAARTLIDSGQFDDIISDGKMRALRSNIDGEIRGAEAEQRRAQADARRDAADRRREAHEETRQVADRVRDTTDYLHAGGQISPIELRTTIAAAAGVGRPELAREVERLGVASIVTTQFRGSSPVALQDHVHDLDARINAAGDKAPASLLAEREASGQLLGSMTTALRNDPLSWASRAGTATLAPIDWNNPDTMRARVAPARATARHYGSDLAFFTDEEKASLAHTLATASPDAKLNIARNLARGFGGDSGAALKSLGLNGTFTHAAGLATYGGQYADVSRRIFVGQEAGKTSTLIPQGDKVASLARDTLGRALAYQPQTMTNAVAAANALYVERAGRRGIKSRDEFDEDLWKKGLNEALGGVGGSGGLYTPGTAGVRGYVRSNKPQVVLPVGMTPEHFDDLLYNISPAEVKAAGGGKLPSDSQGRPLSLSSFRGASLFSKGDGKYLVSMDANGTQFLRGAGPNGYYVLDMKALDRVRTAGGADRK